MNDVRLIKVKFNSFRILRLAQKQKGELSDLIPVYCHDSQFVARGSHVHQADMRVHILVVMLELLIATTIQSARSIAKPVAPLVKFFFIWDLAQIN